MKKLLLTIIIWIVALSCFGQEVSDKNSFSLNFGNSYLARQDMIFSPLIHTDFSFSNIGINYTRQAKLFQKVSLGYGNFNPMVTNIYEFSDHGENKTTYPHSFSLLDVNYLIGKRIKKSEKLNLTIGGLFSMDIQALNYVYGRISNFGYYSASSLGVFGRYQFLINDKSNLNTTLQLPLVSWLSRSPYLVNDDEFIENTSSHSGFKTLKSFIADGKLATWDSWQSFDWDIKYMYQLYGKWQLGAAYLVEFTHTGQPRNLLSYRQSINLSVNLRF